MRVKALIIQLTFTLLVAANGHGQEREENLPGRAKLYEPLIASAAARYGIDPRLLWTIAYLESRFQPHVISYKDGRPCAYGLMQFIPATAQRYGLKNPLDPTQAVDAAARYVRDLQVRFGGRGDLVLAAYNAGEGTIEAFRDGKKLVLQNGKVINPNSIRTGGMPPYRETREYVARGKIIYERISRAGLFLPRPTTSSRGAIPLVADSEGLTKQDSIYLLEFSEQGTEERGKSPENKAFQRQSLYPN
jgi:soluble lytic murein transglycosylase-like protein